MTYEMLKIKYDTVLHIGEVMDVVGVWFDSEHEERLKSNPWDPDINWFLSEDHDVDETSLGTYIKIHQFNMMMSVLGAAGQSHETTGNRLSAHGWVYS